MFTTKVYKRFLSGLIVKRINIPSVMSQGRKTKIRGKHFIQSI